MELDRFFETIVRRFVPADSWKWMEEQTVSLLSDFEESRFYIFFAKIAKKVGKKRVCPGETEEEIFRSLPFPVVSWTLDEMARSYVLLRFSSFPALPAILRHSYWNGDNRERMAVLKTLSHLPLPGRFVEIALDACRTNVLPIFASLACDNPFPSLFFDEPSFNNLVLKAVFMGLPVERIMGLEKRFNPELARMSDHFADERESAGRPVPWDLWRLIAPFGDEKSVRRITRYLANEEPMHRYWAAFSLGETGKKDHVGPLKSQWEREKNEEVRRALETAMKKCGPQEPKI